MNINENQRKTRTTKRTSANTYDIGWIAAIARTLAPISDERAGGCHTHPPCTPLSDRMGSWPQAFAACYSTGRRGDATPIPSHPPVRPYGFLVRRHLPYVAVRPAGGGMPHPSPLHPPFLPYGFMGRGRLPHVAVRQAGGGMPHPFPPAPSFPTALVPGPHVKQMQDRRAARAGQQTNIKPLAANNV